MVSSATHGEGIQATKPRRSRVLGCVATEKCGRAVVSSARVLGLNQSGFADATLTYDPTELRAAGVWVGTGNHCAARRSRHICRSLGQASRTSKSMIIFTRFTDARQDHTLVLNTGHRPPASGQTDPSPMLIMLPVAHGSQTLWPRRASPGCP